MCGRHATAVGGTLASRAAGLRCATEVRIIAQFVQFGNTTEVGEAHAISGDGRGGLHRLAFGASSGGRRARRGRPRRSLDRPPREPHARSGSHPPAGGQHHGRRDMPRSEEHTSELQSHVNLVCRLLLEKKKKLQEVAIAALWYKTCQAEEY